HSMTSRTRTCPYVYKLPPILLSSPRPEILIEEMFTLVDPTPKTVYSALISTLR
ncbi:hypothetical protein L9F63_021346, partial [Diploptera punctata]